MLTPSDSQIVASDVDSQPTLTPVRANASASSGSDRKRAAAAGTDGLDGELDVPVLRNTRRVATSGIDLTGRSTTFMPLPSSKRAAPLRPLSSAASLIGRPASVGSTSAASLS